MLVPPHVPFWSLTGAAEQCPGVEELTPQTHQLSRRARWQRTKSSCRTCQRMSARSLGLQVAGQPLHGLRWPSAVSSATPAQGLPLRRRLCVPLAIGQRAPALALLP